MYIEVSFSSAPRIPRNVLHEFAYAHSFSPSVDFDGSVDPVHEDPARKEADGTYYPMSALAQAAKPFRKGALTSQYKKQERDQKTIPYIKHPTGKAPKAQIANPIQQGIRKHIECACSGRTERSPLPMIVLRA